MKYSFTKWCIALVPVLGGCSLTAQFVRLKNDRGETAFINQSSPCILIFIDSLKTDSSQYRLFGAQLDANGFVEASSYWAIRGINTVQQRIEFVNCRDTTSVILSREQIKYIIRGPGPFSISPQQMVNDILVFPLFIGGMICVSWGVISLPIPSTPWREDFQLIGGGLFTIGVVTGAGVLVGKPSEHIFEQDKYVIESLQ